MPPNIHIRFFHTFTAASRSFLTITFYFKQDYPYVTRHKCKKKNF